MKTKLAVFTLMVSCGSISSNEEANQNSGHVSDNDSISESQIPSDVFWIKSEYAQAVEKEQSLRKSIVFSRDFIFGFDGCRSFKFQPIIISKDEFIWSEETTDTFTGEPISTDCVVEDLGSMIKPDRTWAKYKINGLDLTIIRDDGSNIDLIRDEGCTLQDPCGQ